MGLPPPPPVPAGLYLLTVYTVCVWNGASYYIEVFSKAYRKQFEGDAATRRQKAIEALGAPKRPTPPPAAQPAAQPADGAVSTVGGEGSAKKEQ